jgi:hypothetical protein
VPHCFLFRLRFSKCVLQYKLFSFHEVYLPIEPSTLFRADVSLHPQLIDTIPLNSFALVGDRREFLAHMGLEKTTALQSMENQVSVLRFDYICILKFLFVL